MPNDSPKAKVPAVMRNVGGLERPVHGPKQETAPSDSGETVRDGLVKIEHCRPGGNVVAIRQCTGADENVRQEATRRDPFN